MNIISLKYFSEKMTPWFLWILAASFYFLIYLLQVSPTVIRIELTQSFSFTASTFGLLSALFFYSYAGMQLPAGILFDIFGIKKVLFLAALSCSLGCFIFYFSHSLFCIYFARILMGLGAGCALVGCLHIINEWFSSEHFSLLTGLTLTLGMFGAIFGLSPLAVFIKQLGWRNSFLVLAWISLFLTVLLLLFIRNKQQASLHGNKNFSLKSLTGQLGRIVSVKSNWLISVVGGLLFMGIPSFAGLWGVAFIERVYSVSTVVAATATSLVFVGFAIGAPFFGWITQYYKNHARLVILSFLLSLLVSTLIIYGSGLSFFVMHILLFALGFLSSGVTVTILLIKNVNAHADLGTAVSFRTMITALISVVPQPLIGLILDFLTPMHGHQHSLHDFHIALSLLPIFFAVGLFLSFFIKEPISFRSA